MLFIGDLPPPPPVLSIKILKEILFSHLLKIYDIISDFFNFYHFKKALNQKEKTMKHLSHITQGGGG